MMDLQKVKEARNRFAKVIVSKLLGSLEANPIHISEIETVLVQYQEALAELEKPAEDGIHSCTTFKCYLSSSDCKGCCLRPDCFPNEPQVQAFAESYHAKKCAECKNLCARGKESCEDFEPFPRFEKRSGVTTDVAELPDAENLPEES